MSHAPNFLNPRSIQSCKVPAGKRNHLYPDTSCPGLHLYASARGARIWKFRYNFAGKRNNEIDLGAFPHVSYEDARERAGRLYRAVKVEGRDPRLVGVGDKPQPTFGEVLDHYVGTLSKSSQTNLASKLRPLRAAFAAVPATEVDSKAVYELISQRWGTKFTTERLVARNITAAYNRALDPFKGLGLPATFQNPFVGFSAAFEAPEDWVPSSRKVAYEDGQYEAIFRAFRLGRADPKMSTLGVLCMELTLLTGARPSEVQSLLVGEVAELPDNPGAGLIQKPRHKTSKKTLATRKIRVGPHGMAVLAEAAAERARLKYDGPYVFPAARIQKNNRHAPHFTSSWAYAKRLSAKVGFDFNPGSFRAAYINHTLSQAEGSRDFAETLKTVAENVGHADVQTTLRHYVTGQKTKGDEIAVSADKAFEKYMRAA